MTTTTAAPLSAEQLDALDELAKTATQGPWTATHWTCHAATTVLRSGSTDAIAETSGFGRGATECAKDAAFIAAANPTTILALIAQARAAEKAEKPTHLTSENNGTDCVSQATASPAPRVSGQDQRANCSHAWNDFGQLGGRNASWCPRCDTLAWTGKEPALAQRASSAPTFTYEQAPQHAREAVEAALKATPQATAPQPSVGEQALLPCPHCGGVAHVEEEFRIGRAIECVECGANVGAVDLARGVEMWNRRTLSPSREEAPAAPAGWRMQRDDLPQVARFIVEDCGGMRSITEDAEPTLFRYFKAVAAAPAASVAQAEDAREIPNRISTKWLHEIAQDAGFNLNMLGELVCPSPHHDVEPYLRRLLKLVRAAQHSAKAGGAA